MNLLEQLNEQGRAAKAAARVVATADSAKRDLSLALIAEELVRHTEGILDANALDVADAERNGIGPVMIDRLMLNEARIEDMAAGVMAVMAMPDPIGVVTGGITRPNGLRVVKTKVPLGVIGVIYESRPNVTVDAAVLCLKAGNTCLLRGGKEAIHSNRMLAKVMRVALKNAGLPEHAVQLVTDTSRESATAMMRMNGVLDLLIPRGSIGLINTVVQQSTVPVVQTGAGNCHVFIDESAELAMAVEIAFNAKTSRPSTCNAAETLLVHKKLAEAFLPLAKARLDEKGVELRGCPATRAILGEGVKEATQEDYELEFLDYILAVRVVEDVREAVDHIDRYSTRHSDAIVTESYANAEYFTKQVDSAAVYVNASTRFTDGGEFGEGAEIGISNQKLHARGPMGIRHLTADKYIVYGSGQVR